MAKYDPLGEHLSRLTMDATTMTFEEISRLVGLLPKSAYDHREWWGNEAHGSHVQARAWMNAGFRVDSVHQQRETVTFRRR